MLHKRPAAEILEREFLSMRAKILELAADLDRIARGEGKAANSAQMAQIHEAIEVLHRAQGSRAEEVQLIFSRDFDESWRETLKVGR